MERAERWAFVLFGGLLALVTAVVVTSIASPAPHTGGDNAGYLSLGHALATGAGYADLWDPQIPSHTKYPPVFPLLLATLMVAGASSWMAFKLLMAVFVSVAVLLVFVWVSERVGPQGGTAVAVLTLFSSGWLQASRWVLSEPMFLLFTFLALWAVERALTGDVVEAANDSGQGSWSGMGGRPSDGWMIVAGAATIFAFFTRSAGLPLVLALGAGLLVARRFRALALFALALAVPGLWWLARVRGGGEGAYQSEFWMVNPYEPELGTVAWTALPARAWANLRLYVGNVLPGEWWSGTTGGAAVALGILLVALATWGWLARVQRCPATAELFVPFYLGLILVWPEVWSGDRFILPLYPFILLYAGESVARLSRPLGRAGVTAGVSLALLLLLLPALPTWLSLAQGASTCRRIADGGDPVLCQGSGFAEFRDAAVWAGANLPEEAVVLTRKPRIYYLFNGPSGRTFPFTQDPDLFLAEADRLGAGYVLLDHVDTISLFYLPAVIRARPLAFCHIAGWGDTGAGLGTDLLGILPPDQRRVEGDVSQLQECPETYRSGSEVRPLIDAELIPRVAAGATTPQSEPSP